MRTRVSGQCISVKQAQSLLGDVTTVVLDVRDAAPYADRLLCDHGNASQSYAQTLAGFGFSQVYGLNGGFEAWRTARLQQQTEAQP